MYERAVQCLKHSDSQVLIPMSIHVQALAIIIQVAIEWHWWPTSNASSIKADMQRTQQHLHQPSTALTQ